MHRWQHYIDQADVIAETIELAGTRFSGGNKSWDAEDIRFMLRKDDKSAASILQLFTTALWANGALQGARQLAEELYAAYPDYDDIRLLLIGYRAELKDWSSALELLDQVELRHGASFRTRLDRAWCYLTMERYADCMEIVDEVWDEAEASLEDKENLISCLNGLHRYDDALAYIDQLIPAVDESEYLLKSKVDSLIGMGEYEAARELIAELIREVGPQAVALRALGCAYERSGELIKAKACYLQGFEQAPNNDNICQNLALLPDELFAEQEPLPVQFAMRAAYCGGFGRSIAPLLSIRAFVHHRLPMQLIDLLVDTSLGVQLISDQDQAGLLRIGTPFVQLFDQWRSNQVSELLIAEALLRYHLGDVGACFRLIDEQILMHEKEPSFLVRHYWLLAGDMLLEDMDALVRENAKAVQDERGKRVLDVDELYYSAMILWRADRKAEAQDVIEEALQQDPDFLPCRLLAYRFFLNTVSDTDEAQLKALVTDLAKQADNYFRDPRMITLPASGVFQPGTSAVFGPAGEHALPVLQGIMPVLHFLEQFPTLSSVESYILQYRSASGTADAYSSTERPAFSLLRSQEPDAITGLLEDTPGDPQAGVRSLADLLSLGRVEGELGKWVEGYVSMGPTRCISELGLEVYERIDLAIRKPAAVNPASVLEKASRAYLVAGALLKEHPDQLHDVLTLQHYCHFALECWLQAIPSDVASEVGAQVNDQLLKAIGSMDVASDALAFTFLNFNPGLWVCAKGVGKISQWVYAEYIDEGLVPFSRYQELIATRRAEQQK